jgi:flagellar protein FlgJ
VPLDPKLSGLGAAAGTREASTWLDLQGLRQLKAGSEERRPENVRAVAQQFEQVFLGMMLKSMRDAKLADSSLDGEGTRLYQDLYDKQVTLQMAQGRGLGIAEMLVRQLAPDAAKPAPSGGAEAAVIAGVPSRARTSNPKFGAAAMARAYEAVRGPVLASEGPSAPGGAPQSVRPAAEGSGPLPVMPGGLAPQRTGGQPVCVEAPSSEVSAAAAAGARASASRRFADSPEDFVRKVLPHAVAAAAELGVAPAAIVAQAALETGWGRHVPAGADGAGHNLFGIKAGAAWAGRQLGRATVEVANGLAVRTQAAFRAYDSVAAGFRDYVNLLRTSDRYGAVRGAGEDPARFAHALQAGGYATDPHYARKLLQIVNGSTLRAAMAAVGADPAPARLALKTDTGRPIT